MSNILKSIRGMSQTPKPRSDFEAMNMHDLICWIQPEWNRFDMGSGANKFTEAESENLKNALEVYKEKGGDVAYFTAGSGAPGNCTVC